LLPVFLASNIGHGFHFTNFIGFSNLFGFCRLTRSALVRCASVFRQGETPCGSSDRGRELAKLFYK
jgi:hypothetical protein